jgi:hypothetical protein
LRRIGPVELLAQYRPKQEFIGGSMGAKTVFADFLGGTLRSEGPCVGLVLPDWKVEVRKIVLNQEGFHWVNEGKVAHCA